jgi:heme A synthase
VNLRSPVHRLTVITVATAMAFVSLLIALKAVDPNSGVHGVVAVVGMVVALAMLGFAWSLVSAFIANRRTQK